MEQIETIGATEQRELTRIRISVRNLVEFIFRSGDIDNRIAGMDKDAMLMCWHWKAGLMVLLQMQMV